MLFSKVTFCMAVAASTICIAPTALAQTVHLPTVQSFGVQTTASVPDGGTIQLGGVNTGRYGSIDRSVPGLGRSPFVRRGFRSRGIGQQLGSSKAVATAKVISLREIEQQVLAEAHWRNQRRVATGNALSREQIEIQRQARWMTRHMGRRY